MLTFCQQSFQFLFTEEANYQKDSNLDSQSLGRRSQYIWNSHMSKKTFHRVCEVKDSRMYVVPVGYNKRWISPILWDLGDRGRLEGKTFNPIRQSEQHGKVKCGGSRIWRRKAIHNFSSRCLQISQTPHNSRRSKYFFLGILYNLANMTLFEGLRERIELKMRKRKFEGRGGDKSCF